MIRIIYVFSLILLFTPNVMAEEVINFSFTCKVLDQQMLEVMDGKSSRYSGYTDGSKIGDTFKLDFEYTELYQEAYTLSFESNHKDVSLISFVDNGYFTELDDSGHYSWNVFGVYGHNLSENSLRIASVDWQLTGRRYYKNDWNLLLRSGMYDQIFIQTANCMNVPDKLGIILEKIKANHK